MPTTSTIENFVINKVESQEVFDFMKANGLVNDTELYLIPDEGANVTASRLFFADGETLQQKYDQGELKGPQGEKGDTGSTGGTGPAGYTPVRGTDYWTAADQQAIVNAVLLALPAAEGASF